MTDRPQAQTELLLRHALAPVLQETTDVPQALVRDAMRRGRRRRRLRYAGVRLVPLVAALAVAATVVCIRLSATSLDGAPADATQMRAWKLATASPLSPRSNPAMVQVGDDVVILGGSDNAPCPPITSCAFNPDGALNDGAVYEPDHDAWRRIAPAPVALMDISATASGNAVYVLVRPRSITGQGQQFWQYSLTADRWNRLPAPPHRMDRLISVGANRLVAYVNAHTEGWTADQSYDIGSRTWSPVPRDPLAPSEERSLVATDDGNLVLIAVDSPWRPGNPLYPLWRTAQWDAGTGNWTEVPNPGIVDSEGPWKWVAGRVVNPATEQVEQDGRHAATGGILDPLTGTWQPVPPLRTETISRSSVPGAAGSGRILVRGQLLDVRSRTWTQTPEPPARFPTQDATAIIVDNRVVVFGGAVSVTPFKVSLTHDTWVLRLPATTAPAHSSAPATASSFPKTPTWPTPAGPVHVSDYRSIGPAQEWEKRECGNVPPLAERDDLWGLPTAQVVASEKRAGRVVRILGANGECVDRTDDLRVRRVNIYSENGRVKWAKMG